MFEALLPQIEKISDQISALLESFDPGFTSRYSKFREDLTELNLEAFVVLQQFESENIQHTSICVLVITIVIIIQ